MASTTDDKRLTNVESAKKEAIANSNKTYDNMINQTDAQYNELIQANKDYATKQQELQQANTDFAIEQINQQKEKAEKDYTKEQIGAYTDYQKVTDQYGVNAEKQATAGLQNTGYSESSKVQAFTTYQNRYSTAREVYNNAVLSYDNAIKDAQLKNNAQLAEIAYQSLQTQLEYALQGFQYKNELLQTKLNTQIQLDAEYNNRYQQVLSQINTENSLAEQIRQYNESMAYQKQRDAVADAQWQKQYALASAGSSGGSGGSGGGSSSLSGGGSNSVSGSSAQLSGGDSDAKKYGTFSNGYQPKGISGYGELKASGLKVGDVFMNDGSGFSKQKIWQAGGHYFVWDGSIKDYVDVTDKVKTSKEKHVNFLWGR
jgi:hypothetical protein